MNILKYYAYDDIIFYPCNVKCDGEIFDFFVGKILTYSNIVDEENSKYGELTDGSPILYNAVYMKDNKGNILITRDKVYQYLYAVSAIFKELVESYKLNIILKPL